MNEKQISKTVEKLERVFGTLEAEGVVEKVDADGTIIFRVKEGRESDYLGVMGFLFTDVRTSRERFV